MTEPEVAVFTRVDQIPAGAHALLVGTGRLYDSPAWLGYCDAQSGGALRYLVASSDHVIGVLVLRIVADDQVMSLYNVGDLIDQSPPALYPSAVAAVSGTHCVLLVDPTLTTMAQVRVEDRLVGAAVDLAADEGCASLGFLYLPAEMARRVADRVGDSVDAPFLMAAQTQLTGGWPDFDGYLATVNSSRRNKIRRERRQFEESGLSVRVSEGTAELDQHTAEMQLALRERHAVGGSVDAILDDYAQLRTHVDDRVRVFLCERGSEVVGLALTLLAGSCLHVRLVGFDYATLDDDFAYFNVAYYEPIRWGIDHGVTHYEFGTGTYRAKLSRGCAAVPAYGVVRWPEQWRDRARPRLAELDRSLRDQLGLPAEPGTEKST